MGIKYYSRVPFIFPALGTIAALVYGLVSQSTSAPQDDDAGLTEQVKIECYSPSVSSTDFAACASNVLINGNAPSAKKDIQQLMTWRNLQIKDYYLKECAKQNLQNIANGLGDGVCDGTSGLPTLSSLEDSKLELVTDPDLLKQLNSGSSFDTSDK